MYLTPPEMFSSGSKGLCTPRRDAVGHQLHQPLGAFGGNRFGIECGFGGNHRMDQFGIDLMFGGVFLNDFVVGARIGAFEPAVTDWRF